MDRIKHNIGANRFELVTGNRLAILEYQQDGNRIVFTHTEVPTELRGRGLGGAMAKAALNYAAEQNLRVVPACSFIAAYIERNPQYARLLDSD